MPRKKILKSTEAELLVLSKRRCCICFFLKYDTSIRKGQIAHLDQNPANNSLDNLAWLCLEHHDEYDSRTSQTKNLKESEVRHHRECLYNYLQQEEKRQRRQEVVEEAVSESWRPDAVAERVWSNLLELKSFPPTIFAADTEYRRPKDLWQRLSELSSSRLEAPVVLAEGKILTFQNLHDDPWCELCVPETIEELPSDDLSQIESDQGRRNFVQLMNRCLKQMLWPTVAFSKDGGYYYYRRPRRGQTASFSYLSRSQNATATLFAPYTVKDGSTVSFYRHGAFYGAFMRFDGSWYLAIEPTFHFTRDGRVEDRFASERLAKKKRFERNGSVLGQTIMWAELVKSRYMPLLPTPFDLVFGDLLVFRSDVGIDESGWETLATDDPDDGMWEKR